LKQATLILALLGAILLVGCGNGDTTSQTTYNNGTGDQPFKPTTHLSHRSIVTNYYAGDLAVVDATQDRLTTYTFAVGALPTYMQSSPDGTLTLVNNSGANSISSFNNSDEAVKATIQLGGSTESFVTSTDDFIGFAAVPNYSNGNPPILPGAVARFNPTDGSLNTFIPFPYVHFLAMDNTQTHLLAFTQGDASAPNGDDNIYWVDLTTLDPATGFPAVAVLTPSATGAVSRPIAAFFSSDSSKAYILNCGTECGGSAAPSVTEIDGFSYNISGSATGYPSTPVAGTIHTGSATVVNQWTVKGARQGLIDTTANKLYVAGSSTTLTDSGGNNVQDGWFTVIDLAAGTAASPIQIGNGVKYKIRNINGVFWVGSQNCGVQSCVSLVNPSSGSASTLANANGDATGIAYQSNSGEVYTIEGSHFYMYNQQGNPLTSEYNTDIKGTPYDVLYIN
jgi:hypothetical protein